MKDYEKEKNLSNMDWDVDQLTWLSRKEIAEYFKGKHLKKKKNRLNNDTICNWF